MKYMVSKGRLRRVRTLAGVKFFGAPIGTLITPGMAFKARRTHGEEALKRALEDEDNAPEPGTDVAVPGQASVVREYVEVRDQYGAAGMDERARRQKELRDLRRQAMNRNSQ